MTIEHKPQPSATFKRSLSNETLPEQNTADRSPKRVASQGHASQLGNLPYEVHSGIFRYLTHKETVRYGTPLTQHKGDSGPDEMPAAQCALDSHSAPSLQDSFNNLMEQHPQIHPSFLHQPILALLGVLAEHDEAGDLPSDLRHTVLDHMRQLIAPLSDRRRQQVEQVIQALDDRVWNGAMDLNTLRPLVHGVLALPKGPTRHQGWMQALAATFRVADHMLNSGQALNTDEMQQILSMCLRDGRLLPGAGTPSSPHQAAVLDAALRALDEWTAPTAMTGLPRPPLPEFTQHLLQACCALPPEFVHHARLEGEAHQGLIQEYFAQATADERSAMFARLAGSLPPTRERDNALTDLIDVLPLLPANEIGANFKTLALHIRELPKATRPQHLLASLASADTFAAMRADDRPGAIRDVIDTLAILVAEQSVAARDQNSIYRALESALRRLTPEPHRTALMHEVATLRAQL